MRKPLDIHEYKIRLKRLYGNQYTLLGTTCNGVKDRVKIRHNYCGYTWCPRANEILNKHNQCPICTKGSFTPKSYDKYVKIISGWAIIVLDDYIDSHSILRYKCIKHNYVFKRSPLSFRRSNYRCKYCKYEHTSKVQRKSNNQFLGELSKKHNNKIIALEPYINTHTKIKFKCMKCNNTWSCEPNSVLRLSSCPNCRNYHGEQVIKDYLQQHNINYEYVKKFNDCVYKRKLHYDFYLPNNNILIEYDGLQHYKPIEFFGGKTKYQEQVIKDKIKTNYAKLKGIRLIRIRYKEKDTDLVNELENKLFYN